MGNWGNAVEDCDIYADVEAEFLEQLSEGVSHKVLLSYFLEGEDFDDISEETHDWWFAIADLFWKIGYLDNKVFQVVKTIIETKADLEYWKECDAEEEDIKERAKNLKAFFKKISTPIKKPMSYDNFVVETEIINAPAEIFERVYTNEEKLKANQLWEDYLKEVKNNQQQAKKWFAKLFFISKKSNIIPPTKKPCFLAGTLVHTSAGNVPIENIKIGDEVYCFDEINQSIVTQLVSETFTNYTQQYIRLTTLAGEEISVTGQHLFYQKTSKTWIKAHQLKAGMKLYAPQIDELVSIKSIEVVKKQETTYNFEVPVHHNYFVGKQSILAHNANKRPSYATTTTRKYAFYQLVTLDNNLQGTTEYIGKTTRESLNIRNAEHEYFGKKKGPNSRHYWKFKLQPQIVNLNTGKFSFVEMTEFESAVWEKYYLEEHRTRTGKKLRNIQNPLSEKSFKKYKKFHANSNPCLFFV